MTAIVYSGTLRYFKRKSRRRNRSGWKGALVWYCVGAIAGFFVVNGIYQVIRKPSELFAPISASLSKSPETTWQSYGSLFEKHSTKIISPELLAALAQVEGSGNPIARTYWRWQWSWNPFEIYRPASSALGMFQITDGTFAEARKYCIRDHKVVTEGRWHDLRSCWFNSFYTRTLPSHATEMTAAYLDRKVINTLAARPGTRVTPVQKEKLAAVIHLCGSKRGDIFARRGFRAMPAERCGTHSLRRYLTKIDLMKKRFARLRGLPI
ncbi:MAG: lytic transglycosylase domain-containing protein [Candidatus Binatia bacterium]